MVIFFKELFKPTKGKLLFVVGLFLIIGTLKIFTLQNSITGVVYKNSLFQQYQFQYQHLSANWYNEGDKVYWFYFLFLHIIFSYIAVCLTAFIVGRLWGE
jgi:hypothetical protein